MSGRLRGAAASRIAFGLLPCVLAAVVFAPIARNYFHADDFHYLYLLNDGRVREFLLTANVGHVQPVRNLLFLLFHALFGTDPRGYFVLVLATHVLNVALLYVLVRRLTHSDRSAAVAAGLWGIAPTAEGSLGWYSVYGHVVVGTLLLVALLQVVRPAVGKFGLLVAYAAMLAASVTFGVGLGLAVVFPAAAALLMADRREGAAWRVIWTLPLAACAAHVLVYALYSVVAGRTDTLSLGLLASLRDGWWFAAAMFVHLVTYGVTSLLLGWAWFPVGYPRPVIWVVAGAVGLGVLMLAARPPGTVRRAVLASVVLTSGAYAVIAMGRAPWLLSVFGSLAATATLPRYHYAATIPLALLLGFLTRHVAARVGQGSERLGTALVLLWAAASLGLGVGSARPATRHANDRRETDAVLAAIRRAVCEKSAGEAAYVPNQVFQSADLMNVMGFPGWVGVYVAFFDDDTLCGKRVFFVGADYLVQAFRKVPSTRTAGLLVTESEARRGADDVPAVRHGAAKARTN
jgi:hypothetical protein